MATILLFHHALGQTPGFLGFAEHLRRAGHTVHTPDLYDGLVFDDLDAGVAHAESLTMERLITQGVAAADELAPQGSVPPPLAVAGFSLGTLPAQAIAQRRSDVRAALLYHGGLPSEVFGGAWPQQVAVQIHVMQDDPWRDVDENQALIDEATDGELFVYPGDRHLFADPSTPDHDPVAARLLLERSLDLLNRLG